MNSFQWYKHKDIKNQNLKIWELKQKQLAKSAYRYRWFHVERVALSEVMIEPEISLKNKRSFLNVAILHSLNCMWHFFLFRAYLNPNPYTVHSFLVNQGLASHWFLPFHILLIERSCMLWLRCHTYTVHCFIDFHPPSIFRCLSLQYLKHSNLRDWQETFKAVFHTGSFRQ